jgi:hypothetical protein
VTAVAVSRPAGFRPARLLRLEIRHSPFLWALPVLAALFYYDTYRTSAGLPPIWTIRATVVTDHMLNDFSVFAAGLAAWAGSREGRRKTGDLLATTVRAAWARRATVFAATAFWTLLAFLAGVALVYVQTAVQATWGGPPLWPVAVGVLGVVAACAIGFTCGTFFPGRFTAPLVAVVVLVLDYVGHGAANTGSTTNGTYGVLSPAQPTTAPDVGVFYHVAPDVSIAQVMFIGGVIIVMGGLLALSPVAGRAGRRGLSQGGAGKRVVAAAVALVACGAAASATAFSLAGTAQYASATGWTIPALHDAASDQPVPYTPECAKSGFPVCVHPAFAGYLHAATAALQPAAAEIAGLPGAPVRAEQVASGVLPTTAGTTSVFQYPQLDGLASFWASPADVNTTSWQAGLQQDLFTWFVSGPVPQTVPGVPTGAQQVLVTALMAETGSGAPLFGQSYANGKLIGPSPAKVGAAATRFESLSKAAQHDWLATHLAAIRAGGVTLAQIP